MRRLIWIVALAALAAGLLLAFAYGEAVSEPRVRTASIRFASWPAGQAPLRAVLLSDIHVAGPDMPPERLSRIVAEVNRLSPDVVLIAGDLVSDKRLSTRRYSMAEAIAPLGALRPRLGSYAVLGNHDHWRDAAAAAAALRANSIVLLGNEAREVGPLAIGGLDDDYTGRADVPRLLRSLSPLNGPRIIVSHSPDPFPQLPDGLALMAAGHTHCGQIAPPLVGPLTTMSRHGRRYACGLVPERGNALIVSAGLGTSILPLRLGAPPDLWLIELGPQSRTLRR